MENGTNGTDTLIAIRGEFPRALRSGASGYILKSMPKNELLGVIRAVHAGNRHVPPEVAAASVPVPAIWK
jgi:DNA-binding NarL/FixJ family response regulator